MHLSDDLLLRRIDGELDAEEQERAEAHLAACPSCSDRGSSLSAETDLLQAALAADASELALGVRARLGWREATAVLAALGVGGTALNAPWPVPLAAFADWAEGLLASWLALGAAALPWSLVASAGAGLARLAITTLLLGAGFATLVRAPRGTTAAALALGLLLAAYPHAAHALVFHRGEGAFLLAEGEVLDDDLVVVTGSARIDGDLRGDLVLAAADASIGGRIGGDVIGAVRRLSIDGTVEGDVRVVGESVELRGSVLRSLSAGASVVEVSESGRVGGSLAAGAALVRVQGPVGRNVMAGANTLALRAPIGGDALLVAERLELGAGTRIQGAARYYGTGQVETSPEAVLAQPLEVVVFEMDRRRSTRERVLWFALRFGAAFVLGLCWLLIAPSSLRTVAEQANRVGASLLVGLAALLATPLLAIAIGFTVVGIPVGVLALGGYAATLYAAQVFVAHWAARRLFGDAATTLEAVLRLALALFALHVLAQLPLAGGALRLIVLLWGLGAATLALIVSVVGRYRVPAL